MKLTILNCTLQELSYSWISTAQDAPQTTEVVAFPSAPIIIDNLPGKKLRITTGGKSEKHKEQPQASVDVDLKNKLGLATRSYRMLEVAENSPFRVFLVKEKRSGYRLQILQRRDLAAFLSEIPDTTPLSALVLPGTHDTMAFYGWPISQCQDLTTPLEVQLHSGIRVLDIRLAVIDGHLECYHGIYPQRTRFTRIIEILSAFLTSPQSSRETIVMSMKQEDWTNSKTFFSLVLNTMAAGPLGMDMWYMHNRIPTLGEVRGKMVLFSRFGGNAPREDIGIHPTYWPDSEKKGFTWKCKDVTVRTQDWYGIPSILSIPEKVQLSTEILRPSSDQILSITYFSAASFPFAAPPVVAQGVGWPSFGLGIEGVNSRVGRWLLDRLAEDERLSGWALMDYFSTPGKTLGPLLAEFNFVQRPKA